MVGRLSTVVGREAAVVGRGAAVVGRRSTVVGRQCCRGLRDSRSKGLEFNIAYNSFGGTVSFLNKTYLLTYLAIMSLCPGIIIIRLALTHA